MGQLRPKLKLFKSLQEADEGADRVDKEMLKALKDRAPDLTVYLQNEGDQEGQSRKGSGGLGAIAEEAEDEEEDEDHDLVDVDDDDEEEELEGMREHHSSQRSASRSASAMGHEGEDLSMSPEGNLELSQYSEDEDEDEHDPEMYLEPTEPVLPVAPKHVKCEEDDDFLAALDKMVNDSVAESRAAASVPRGQQVNIVAPISVNKLKKNAPFGKLSR